MNPPVLMPPVPERPLILYMTVLDESMGCMLGQHDESGKRERVVYYLSKKFTACEMNYFLLSQPTLLWASEARLSGASSKGGKYAESPPMFICGKRQKNRRKPVIKNIPDSGVAFTFEEGISTSHVCPKGQHP